MDALVDHHFLVRNSTKQSTKSVHSNDWYAQLASERFSFLCLSTEFTHCTSEYLVGKGAMIWGTPLPTSGFKKDLASVSEKNLEREKGFEPSTLALARRCSTTELFPLD